ncbi:MFS transporter [Streptomyces sp. NPDC059629]|uniref:MFS transporter n=1 Tax=Streptomyces sp. NPDC059629 TaxID=3346889 RepID=UPI00368C40DC
MLLTGHLSWALPAAAANTLLQARLASEQPHHKVAAYGLITVVGAVSAVVSTAVCGGLSDRTRSRFGRRSPWILGGSAVSATGLTLTGVTSLFPVEILGFTAFQAGMNAMLSAMYALLPDRFAPQVMGRASAVTGIGYLLGTALGGVAASALAGNPGLGLRILPWVMVLAALVLFGPAREVVPAPAAAPRAPLSLSAFLPPRDGDFIRVLVGRFCVLLALYVVVFYQLYIFTDLLGLGVQDAAREVALCTIILGTGALLALAVAGPLSDQSGRRRPWVVAASLIVALGTVFPLSDPGLPTMRIFYAIAGIGYGTYLAVDQALVAEVLPTRDNRAREMGFMNIANSAPVVLGPVCAAGVVSLAGYRSLFAVALALALLGGGIVQTVGRSR